MLRVLIIGGRDLWPDEVARWLNEHLSGPLIVIHSSGPGAAEGARQFGDGRGETIPYVGKGAEPVRIRWMLDEGKPDLVIAFSGGRNIDNCCRQALKRGIAVLRITLGSRTLPPPRRTRAVERY